MRRLLPLFVLVLLTVPAWADGPMVKLSVTVPAGWSNYPVINDFDPLGSEFNTIRLALDPGPLLTMSYSADTPTLETSGTTWGVRVRVHPGNADPSFLQPLGISLAWTKGQHSDVVIKSRSDRWDGYLSHGCRNPGEPCYRYNNTAVDWQTNSHHFEVHTFRLGVHYDLLYRSRHASLEPGVGIEISTARHVRAVHRTRELFPPGPPVRVIQDTKEVSWNHGLDGALYLSVDGEIFPFGKGGPGIGFNTRYLPNPPTWGVAGETLANSYEIPFRHRRWSTELTATLTF